MDDSKSSAPSEPTITTKVVRGGSWIYGRRLVTSVLNLGAMAILARQLTPAEFGLVALAQVILRFLAVLGARGVSDFVIYDNDDGREERVHAAFWMDLSFSTFSALVGLSLLPLVVRFYNEPALGPILIALLLRFPVDSLSQVPDALIKKDLDFQKLEIRDTVLYIFSSLASVGMALTGWGVWSLVVPGLIVSPLRAIIVMWMSRWVPGLTFRFRQWPRIFAYSANVIGSTLMHMIITDGDTLLIGKFLGADLLGIYNIAWQSANLVTRNITVGVSKLTMPALSAVSTDPKRLRNGLNRMFRVLAIVAMPLLIGLFVVADDFILTIYGSQWKQAVLPLRILIIYAIRYAVGSPAGVVLKVLGRPDLNFKLNAFVVPFYLGAIWLGSAHGIVGVAVGVTTIRTILGIAGFWLAGKLVNVRFMDMLSPLGSPFLAASLMGLVVFLFKMIWEIWLPGNNIASLLIFVGVGGLSYLVLLRTLYNPLARDLTPLTESLIGRYQGMVSKVLNVN